MKITFLRSTICDAVAPLMSGISGKTSLTVTEGILIEAKLPNLCRMTTFDLEKGVQLTIEATVIEEGSAVINASRFSQTVRAMEDGFITLTVDDKNSVKVTCGKASSTMSAMSASEFPDLPRLVSANGFTVPRHTLRGMIGKGLYAMGINDQRPFLNGMYMSITDGKLDIVSCDSFRMAVCSTAAKTASQFEREGGLDIHFILPNKSVGELYKLLEVKNDTDEGEEEPQALIHMFRKNIVFDLGGLVFFSRLIDAEYMDYNRVIIRNHTVKVQVERELLLGALERAALITEEKLAGAVRSHVKLELCESLLKISAVSGAGSSYDEIPVLHEGKDMVIAFNNRYLMDTLRACRAEQITISMTSAMSSINIEPVLTEEEIAAGDSDLFFLLPVRMKD